MRGESQGPFWPRLIVLLAAAAVLALIALIASGLLDPQPVGALRWRRSLGALDMPASGRCLRWQPDRADGDAFSARLETNWAAGELDVGQGLVLGLGEEQLVVAVSPLGYVAIWREATAQDGCIGTETALADFLLPWQTWPHVRGPETANEIWIDYRQGWLTLRVNRERLWEGFVGKADGRLGIVGQSYGAEGRAAFPLLEYYAP